MHEMSIAMQVVEIAVASIPPDLKGARVERVNLKIGKLSAVVPDSLQFCFSVAIESTLLEGAELFIEEVPVLAACGRCSHRWTIDAPVFCCPQCRSANLEILTGRELDIESIELYQEDENDDRLAP